jgi:hypothetical protein
LSTVNSVSETYLGRMALRPHDALDSGRKNDC